MQAPVEIRYEGAILAKAVAPTGTLDEGGTLFLPVTDPMPVGTRLELRAGGEVALVRVVKVTESPDARVAGMAVRPAGVAEPEPLPIEPEPIPEPPRSEPPGAESTRPESRAVRPVAASATGPAPTGPAPTGPTSTEPSGAQASVSGTIQSPASLGETGEHDLIEMGEGDDTASTSEYPVFSNGQGKKRRSKRRKP